MKQSVNILKSFLTITIILVFSLFFTNTAKGQTNSNDSVEVSLLTCAPHNEVYSLYGHTALRYHDLRTGEDLAFNYGVFNFKKPFFILRFLFGLTDYELGVIPYDIFREEYRKDGRSIIEQVINLTADEKQKLYEALKVNYRPENRTYRYNYFYDNCTTRARDMIENCINGTVKYATPKEKESNKVTYRQMIHEKNAGHPWAAFGNDLCLGVKADLGTSTRQQQFLPENLMNAFNNAEIITGNNKRPLVKETILAVNATPVQADVEFPLTPSQCSYILLLVSIIIIIIEIKRRKTLKIWDVLLLTCQGLAGIIILALFFSEHPTTSTNLQIFLFNPLPLFFLPSIIKGRTIYWRISAVLLIIFYIGNFFQDYAEGMNIVALCLLLRCIINLTLAQNIHKARTNKG